MGIPLGAAASDVDLGAEQACVTGCGTDEAVEVVFFDDVEVHHGDAGQTGRGEANDDV